ncbi:hypothetical protein [Neobacillus niacini]|nr:hypothetical protein [Neobacillus niacini]
MIISFVVGTTLLINGEMVFGILATVLGILFLLFYTVLLSEKEGSQKEG